MGIQGGDVCMWIWLTCLWWLPSEDFPKIVFHGISGRVTRRFMWAFIKRTSVPAANHLVNMAKFCRRVFAFSFKMGQYMGGNSHILQVLSLSQGCQGHRGQT